MAVNSKQISDLFQSFVAPFCSFCPFAIRLVMLFKQDRIPAKCSSDPATSFISSSLLWGFLSVSLFEGQRVTGEIPGLGEVLALLVLGGTAAVPQGILGLLLARFPVIFRCLAVAFKALEASLAALIAFLIPLRGKLVVVIG